MIKKNLITKFSPSKKKQKYVQTINHKIDLKENSITIDQKEEKTYPQHIKDMSLLQCGDGSHCRPANANEETGTQPL